MKLSEVRDKPTRITVHWQGETADMEVYVGRLTPELFDEIVTAEKLDDVSQSMACLIEWWDIIDDDGNQLPAEPETVPKLPMGLIREIVFEMSSTGSDEGKASHGG